MATLGISTNTRLFGMAIINEGRLKEYRVRLYKSPWSPAKATKIVTSLEPCVNRYCIKKVVLSIPPEHHQTKAFKTLRAKITAYFAKRNIPLVCAPPETLLAFSARSDKKVKLTLMKALISHYTELRDYYQKELRNKRQYYIKVFEATAVAAVHEGQ